MFTLNHLKNIHLSNLLKILNNSSINLISKAVNFSDIIRISIDSFAFFHIFKGISKFY